jgi:hypothetical protein
VKFGEWLTILLGDEKGVLKASVERRKVASPKTLGPRFSLQTLFYRYRVAGHPNGYRKTHDA